MGSDCWQEYRRSHTVIIWATCLFLLLVLPACSRAPDLAGNAPLAAAGGPITVVYPGGARWVVKTPQGVWQARSQAVLLVSAFPVSLTWENKDSSTHELMFLDCAGDKVTLGAGASYRKEIKGAGAIRFHLHEVVDLPALEITLRNERAS